MTSPPSTSRQRALPQNGEGLVCPTRSGVPWPQDCGQKTYNGECKSEGHPQVGTSRESAQVSLISWVSELLLTLHQRLLRKGNTLDGLAQEKPDMALVRRVPTCIRRLKEDNLQGTCPHSSGPH